MFTPKKMILTAGPKVGKNDLKYVKDAVKNGWNFHHSDYIYRFEKAFASYVGMKHALAVSTGTHALHIGLLIAGVKPGDEVILPNLTYVACANVIHYIGASPVFVDVEKSSWSIDPKDIEKHITKKTKAIMPVHLYGAVADIHRIAEIAKKYNLSVIDDTCEGLGCEVDGKKLGSHADVSCFSFQGAKLVAIGEGGMVATNNTAWYERAQSLVDHGIDFQRQFWAKEIGYMYPMNNISAALGLSRLEDIEDLVKRKRQIFSWYKERLGDIKGLTMNPELPGVKSSFWMTSIVLDKDIGISRDDLRIKLKENKIDTRPFFFPITDFGFYTKQSETPAADYLSYQGINLPSGVMLREETVDYVSRMVRKFLKV